MTANKSCVSWIGREIWRREKEAVVEQEMGRRRNVWNKWTEAEQVDDTFFSESAEVGGRKDAGYRSFSATWKVSQDPLVFTGFHWLPT